MDVLLPVGLLLALIDWCILQTKKAGSDAGLFVGASMQRPGRLLCDCIPIPPIEWPRDTPFALLCYGDG
jgi:hypothetical protein